MMNTQIERWKETYTWNELQKTKNVLIEPRYGGELDEVMTEYRTVIRDTSNSSRFGITGALLFAVFRGKVAEGIDFSDNEARCVLTVRNSLSSNFKFLLIYKKMIENESKPSRVLTYFSYRSEFLSLFAKILP